jgi:hypothetical protein
MTTGEHIKAAMDRAHHHQFIASRALRVRIMTQWSGSVANRTGVIFTQEWIGPGLLVRAHLSSRNLGDMEKQGHPGDLGVCERLVKWEELDARAHELVGLVDQCVAGVYGVLGEKNPELVG